MARAARGIVAAFAVAACGGAARPAEPEFRGDAVASPSLGVLPRPGSEPRTALLDEGMRLATDAFTEDAPVPPARPTVDALTGWSQNELRPWLTRHTDSVRRARERLDAAAEESERQRIVAGAVVGLLYEDVWTVLSRIPTPVEFDSEPEIGDVFRAEIAALAAPYLDQARRAFDACARNADHPESELPHWVGFCARRRDALPEPRTLANRTETGGTSGGLTETD